MPTCNSSVPELLLMKAGCFDMPTCNSSVPELLLLKAGCFASVPAAEGWLLCTGCPHLQLLLLLML
jgi:hypothetical protein